MPRRNSEKLVLEGGEKAGAREFPPWPQFDRRTDRVVLDILHSGRVNYWTGPMGLRFEAAWAKWLGVRHAVSVTSGTAALHVALAALGIGAGDEVVCPSYSFIASSFCILQTGALPVFCDVGTDHLIDPKKIAACLTPRTKAIVVVHLYGGVVDMDPILRLAKRRGLFVIEDCAQCVGGVYKGRKVGSLGTMGCFSFCQSKHITTGGEGGMVCCNDDALAGEVRSLRDHGYDVRAKLGLRLAARRTPYVHRRVGYNFRMTEIQAAIGLSELLRFDSWNLPRRRARAQELMAGLVGHPLVRFAPVDTAARQHAFWLVPFVLDTAKLACPMSDFVAAVQAEGASVQSVLWPEMYREEAFVAPHGFGTANYPFRDPANRPIDYTAFDCSQARALAEATIAFWAHPTYMAAHMRADIRAFEKVARHMMRTRP